MYGASGKGVKRLLNSDLWHKYRQFTGQRTRNLTYQSTSSSPWLVKIINLNIKTTVKKQFTTGNYIPAERIITTMSKKAAGCHTPPRTPGEVPPQLEFSIHERSLVSGLFSIEGVS